MQNKDRYVCFLGRLFIDNETDKLVYIDVVANKQDRLIKKLVKKNEQLFKQICDLKKGGGSSVKKN